MQKHYIVGILCIICLNVALPFIECKIHSQCHLHPDEPAQEFVSVINSGTVINSNVSLTTVSGTQLNKG